MAHIDCDAFYAAIEKRDDPALADRPVIVGGGKRGVVSTCCYVARTYGVRSAMPMFKALQACPDAVVIRPDMAKYAAVSRQIRAMMEALTPLVEPLSIDEAFLDLSGTERVHGAPPAVALARLQQRIEREIGVTVSVGLSHNKFLAKIASDLDKPRGFAVIGRAQTLAFLAPQPVSLIWGVGAAMTARLARDGFATIGRLQKADPAELARRYGETGLRLARLSRGEDARPVRPEREAKSVSAETTFEANIRDLRALEDVLWALCEKVSMRMKKANLLGRVVTLKLKDSKFRTITRRETLDRPSNLARAAFAAARALLAEAAPGRAWRLIGVGFSDLANDGAGAAQDDLFGDPQARLAAQERAIDEIRAKFGAKAIAAGRALRPKGDQARND
ncbi:DNA polymerase-4 [Amphiplicatus metriothermophilus]|nr:DNA polymerase-4 [Amphiplicatus metriothermophilus]